MTVEIFCKISEHIDELQEEINKFINGKKIKHIKQSECFDISYKERVVTISIWYEETE